MDINFDFITGQYQYHVMLFMGSLSKAVYRKRRKINKIKNTNVLIKAIISFPLGRLDKGYKFSPIDMYHNYYVFACFVFRW